MEEKDTAAIESTEPTESPEPVRTDEPVAEPVESDVDYAAVLSADIDELKASFAELGTMQSIDELADPIRFGALRDLGLTAKEAYLASGGKKRTYDNRTHLFASVPASARSAVADISRQELDMAKSLFDGMSDSEIQKLYRKVTQ